MSRNTDNTTGLSKRTKGHDEWLTPPEIVRALGVFNLDPCAPVERPWELAARSLTKEDDGLKHDWEGRVFCNPPYGAITGKFLKKLSEHGNGIALTFARTETKMFFQHVFPKAHAIFFFEGRLSFYTVQGKKAPFNGGAPSCLIAYGELNALALELSGLKGITVYLR